MRYGTSTLLSPHLVREMAERYFGALGLELICKEDNRLGWKSPHGYVTLQIYPAEESEVDIITLEWDSQVKKFIQRIG